MVWCDMLWWGVVWCGMVWYGSLRCYVRIRIGVVWYDMVWCRRFLRAVRGLPVSVIIARYPALAWCFDRGSMVCCGVARCGVILYYMSYDVA